MRPMRVQISPPVVAGMPPMPGGGGVPCDPCATPGWRPGPPNTVQQLPFQALPLERSAGNPCDPRLGLDIRSFTENGRVSLSVQVLSIPAPPQLWQPITGVLTTSDRWTTVVSRLVPSGFNAISAKVKVWLNATEWGEAIEWAVFTGSTLESEIWSGQIAWPDSKPLARVALPGTSVDVRARVKPAYWWTTGTEPITSLLVANAWAQIDCVSVAGPC